MKTAMMSLVVLFSLLSASAFSQENAKANAPKGPTKEPTKEQREAMALNHEKMAACLRSDKNIISCHKEMRESCMKSGEQNCPGMGMGMGMGGKGKMRGMKK